MPDESIDVLMRIVGKAGVFKGESRTEFAVNPIIDTLRRDFETGECCELREFSFSAGLRSAQDDAEDEELRDRLAKENISEDTRQAVETAFERWSRIRDQQNEKLRARTKAETLDMKEVEFTRVLDSSSTLLFKALTECETLPSISIVKRKAAGTLASGLCFLRLDFEKVLVTDLSWKDEQAGHVMVESGSFIYRTLTLRYRTQKADGSLGPIVATKWDMSAN